MTPLHLYSDKAELLEVDIDKLREENARLRERAADLELAAEAMGRLCYLRRSGWCAAECLGLMICNITGLRMLPRHDLEEAIRAYIFGGMGKWYG